ncbi:uncharacterized protein LOC124165334 isoform X2 [Ischnura elegans]|uniref:uncharacterized protein LOC124165334 isoform X2 n=1 Tax=Ischnura elegans TaxID=197161 RepID=UPI001ED8A46F|nr:uncharacterized protein LOC124165334 isoform X2 [Ischnura elegans]
MQSLLHGNVNVLLGGAMLGGLILVLVLVCYCCHRGMRKSDEEREEEEEEERERRRRLEREWMAEECMGGDGCGVVTSADIRSLEEMAIAGSPRPLFNNNLELQCYEGSGVFYMSEDPRTCPEFDDVFSVPLPPPSYEVAVGKWEEAVSEGTTGVNDEGAVGGTIESSSLPIDSSGLPSYEAALKLEAQGYV